MFIRNFNQQITHRPLRNDTYKETRVAYLKVLLFWIILFSPTVRRLGGNDFVIYILSSTIPIFFLFNKWIDLYSSLGLFFLLCILVFTWPNPSYLYMSVPLVPFVFLRYFKFSILQFDRPLTVIFIALLISYALIQKIHGFFDFELEWFNSSLAKAGKGHLAFEEIRPMSFLAGTPELTFLLSLISTYYFYIKPRIFLFLFFLVLFILSGTRGLILSFLIGLLFSLVDRKKFHNKARRIIYPLVAGSLVYFLLFIFAEAFQSVSGDYGRLSVFGTFYARANIFIEFFSNFSWLDFLYLNAISDGFIFDNVIITLSAKLGIYGLLFYFILLYRLPSNPAANLVISTYVGYSLYADVVYFFYFSVMLVAFTISSSRYYETTLLKRHGI